jgi:hypothetical protein
MRPEGLCLHLPDIFTKPQILNYSYNWTRHINKSAAQNKTTSLDAVRSGEQRKQSDVYSKNTRNQCLCSQNLGRTSRAATLQLLGWKRGLLHTEQHSKPLFAHIYSNCTGNWSFERNSQSHVPTALICIPTHILLLLLLLQGHVVA